MKAFLDIKGQHRSDLLGGMEMNLEPYELAWYPAAFTSTANVGQWVSTEAWKPQV